MKKTSLLIICLVAVASVLPASTSAQKLSHTLETRAARSVTGETLTVWVFFVDKGIDTGTKLAAARDNLTDRARARRLRHRGVGNLVVHYDIPVDPGYVAAVAALSERVRHQSRWLNAVSVEVDKRYLSNIAALSFVTRLDIVRSGRRAPLPEIQDDLPAGPARVPSVSTTLNYGSSFTQNDIMNVIPLHDLGYNGNGVLICMLDAGYNNLGHDAFSIMDILVTRDFVNGDSIVVDQGGQAGTGNHGTYTLSALGGWAPGELIGPAWGATYALGKTENTDWERHIEEDHWVAGAEWADSLGADIISSSLGYRYGFTNGEADYLYTDMDGNTAISTIGADIAAALGILVITSAGNENYIDAPFNTLLAPGDGDSVLAIGAVDGAGTRTSFSSVGLSADARIKPDVMAMGVAVRSASPYSPSGYQGVSGTSLACPLVAGAAALLLEANPNLTNMEIANALRATASQSNTPDRLMGYGIIDAAAAAAMVSTDVARDLAPLKLVLHPAYPNPFNPTTTIAYELPEPAQVTLTVYNVRGQLVRTLVNERQGAGPWTTAWNGTNQMGQAVGSGVYIYRLTAGDLQRSRKLVLLK